MVRTRDDWATSVVLADGETGYLRAMTPADAPALLAFHERQPRENLYRRFFSPKPSLTPTELEHFTNVDFVDRVALVLEIHGEFAAWASYEKWPGRGDADVAFMVDDVHRGKGIATLLLEHLAAIARTNGIGRFTADVLADNRPMLSVFSKAGWPVQRHFDSGVVELEFPLTDTEQFVDSVEQRERRADSRSVARLLLPRSVAVIGASDQPGSIGNEVWRNVMAGGVQPVFPVNPNHPTVGGITAYRSVLDIDHDVWLAVVATPAAVLAQVIDECIDKRVRGAVVLTAVDGTGIDMTAIVAKARRFGMRIIGPASMGVATGRVVAAPAPGTTEASGATDAIATPTPTTAATETTAASGVVGSDTIAPDLSVGVQAALVPVQLPAGGVAISLQSGSLGASLLQLAAQMSMGLSWFVSLGDKSDVSGNDLLQFWEDDERTRVIAIYTESFGNPRKFARIARRVSRRRPIVAVRTGAAALGTASDALYQQAGLIEVPTVRAMLDTARVLASQPVPAGPRVAVLTNSRSPGVLATAALEAAGLEVVPAPKPLDWRSDVDDYGPAVAAAIADPSIDAILVVHAPPIQSARVPSRAIDAAAKGSTKPVVAVMLGRHDGPIRDGSDVPSFSFPEPAAAVLGHLVAYRRWLDTEAEATAIDVDGVDPDAAAAVLAAAAEAGETSLSIPEVQALLRAYGVAVARAELTDAVSVDEVAAVAERVGYPVGIKAGRRRAGRSAEAGIALDLPDADAVRDAVAVMRASLGADAECITVQEMVSPGVDVRIRCTSDERLGAVITVGLGGIMADAIGDEESRLAPVSTAAAANLVHASRLGAALTGAGIDPRPLVDAITRVSHLVFEHPAIGELDINPAIVSDGGCAVVDAHVTVVTAPAETAMRRLV